MPARHLRVARTAARRPRRRLQWADNHFDVTALAIGHYTNFDLLAPYRAMPGAETSGITVVRSHIRIWVTSSVVVGDGVFSAVIVDDVGNLLPVSQTLGAGTGINPQDNPYASWMIYQRWNAHPTYNFFGSVNQWEHDIRSKRRVPFGDTLMLCLANVDASAAVSFSVHARSLLALS